MIKLATVRLGDAGRQALIEFVGDDDKVKKRESSLEVDDDEDLVETQEESAEAEEEAEEADEADEADKEDEPVEQSQKGNATSDGNTPNASPKDSLF